MALVITLILLSVTLIMAVAFLSISRRERNAVTTTTDTASARLAADAALANAEAQIVASIFATTNVAAYNFGLLVSTNYINGLGFQTGVANPTNVNYNYPNGNPVSGNDLIQNIANLFYLPRAPVLVSSNNPVQGRFYLDLNRNGVDDPNGWVTNVDNGNHIILDSQGNPVVTVEVGDPEWIGVLDHPDAPHGPNNRFVSRYAFIAVPVGNALDINAVHNQVFDENNAISSTVNPPPNGDVFFRNQGVGSWEINLAAFLADLNTNEWGQVVGSSSPTLPPPPPLSANYYQYNEPLNNFNQGSAFADARALLAYRYANNYKLLNSVLGLYGGPLAMAGPGPVAFLNDNIDGYSDGLLQTGFQLPADNDNPRLPWAGADNTNQFFTPEELFHTNETEIGATLPGFTDRLLAAGTNTFGGNTIPTYGRYTFYRMLDELGSDTAPESGKINLNYSNAVVQTDLNGIATNIAIVPDAETNFLAWTATNFFMAAADRMLRLYTTNWFQGNSLDYYTNYTTVTNWIYVDPSNYLASYYGVHTNYFSYIDGQGHYIWNAPNGFGLTNLPLFGMTNQIPAFGLTNIPVFVNGQIAYSPAANRLLQLAANIYDATTNSFYPHVFRPLFSRDTNGLGANLFISGYAEVASVSPANINQLFWLPVSASGLAATNIPVINLPVNVYGVPWIIGAKKGFPNFNEFYMESAFELTRKLMVTRQSTNVPSPPPSPTSSFWSYNVMYNLSVSNQFGLECWNSYHSNYTRPLNIYVTDDLAMILTNDEVMNEGGLFNNGFSNHLFASVSVPLNLTPANPWQGYNPGVNPFLAQFSFLTNFPDQFNNGMLPTNFADVPVSRYRFNGGSPYLSTNLNLGYETTPTGFGQYPQPHWWLAMNNNLRVIIVDTSGGLGNWKIIDYVQLNGPTSIRDLSSEITSGYDTVNGGNNTGYNDFWDTNLINGVPIGFANQYNVSQGNANAGNGSPWSAALWGQDEQSAYNQMNAFRVFTMGPNTFLLTFPGYVPNTAQIGAALMTNAMQMPYTPSALVVQDIVWQANDPLVHYMASDLVNPAAAGNAFTGSPFNWYNNYTYADNFATQPGSGYQLTLNWPGNLGALNQRYMPWGGNPKMTSEDTYAYTLAIKDPLVYSSDDWNFPTNKFPTVGWLGRVHRGTPWQTVYLKASDVLTANGLIGTNIWIDRTGNVNPFDAANTAPKKDWLLFDLFTSAFNDNATHGQLSVNVGADKSDPAASLAALSALFSGVMVLSNNVVNPPPSLGAGSMTNFMAFPISPAGPGTNSALWQIVNGIFQTRTNFVNPDGVSGAFEHVGYILSVPQLTTQSPFLNWNNTAQQRSGISDEMYEWLPQQVMSLLREGSPRYVIYCYGQALKPAPNSLVTSGGNLFGMCTNYQVVAESAARAVVRVDGAGTPTPHIVVESYNPLPPD